MDTVEDVKKEPDHAFIASLITSHFSQRLFSEVTDFHMKRAQQDDEAEEPDEEDVYADQLEEYFEDEEGIADVQQSNNPHV